MVQLDENLIERINDCLSDDRATLAENLNDLKERLQIERDQLSDHLIASLPSQYNTSSSLMHLSNEADSIHDQIVELKSLSVKLTDEINAYKSAETNCQLTVDYELKPLIQKSLQIKSYLNYFKSLIEIKSISQKIDAKITEITDKDAALNPPKYEATFYECTELFLKLNNSLQSAKNAEKLTEYHKNLINFYRNTLVSLISKEFGDVLKSINFPKLFNEAIKKPVAPEHQTLTESQSRAKLNHFAALIIKLDVNREENSIPLLIELLRNPLQKRFEFHFYGSKKTNNISKPEWYLSTVMQWLRDNESFINSTIQEIFNKNSEEKINAYAEFIRSLLTLIEKKLNYDFKEFLIRNEIVFSHTIDEILLFDKQLKQTFAYPHNFYSCLHMLCSNEAIFHFWLELEYKSCYEKIDQFFLSAKLNEIWSCSYAEVDENRPPHCTDSFMLLIKTITDRYKSLPFATRRLRFLKMQLELLNDYHLRLCQISRDEDQEPVSTINMGVLNSANYILHVLHDWKHAQFFIELQFIKSRFFALEQQVLLSDEPLAEGLTETSLNESIKFDLKVPAKDCQQFDKEIQHEIESKSDVTDLDKTVFDEIIACFEKLRDDVIKKIVEKCTWYVTSRSRAYRDEKWSSMPSPKEFYKQSLSLSPSATEMFISLKNLRNSMQEFLAKDMFIDILKRLAISLDNFFYESFISNTQFNEGGSAQLDFDINRYLVPILSEFSANVKIENYLRKSKEALLLLRLDQGQSLLLKKDIDECLSGMSEQTGEYYNNLHRHNAKKCLKELGIVQLSLEDAQRILNLRKELKNQI